MDCGTCGTTCIACVVQDGRACWAHAGDSRLYLIHGRATGNYSFAYEDLLNTPMRPETARWIMLGFFASFAVKLPMFPFHTWLPDAHTEAPTAGSVILAGLLLKTGAYGLLRFIFPLFPEAARDAAPYIMILAVVGIIYGAFLAFSQTDLKRLVAYTSVSHLGFVLLGVFAWNELGIQGAVMEMLAHGISTGALFILVGQIQERTHTREIDRMGGLWSTMPRWSGVGFLFTMAAIGLPGLGNFIAEVLVLLGTYRVSVTVTVWAAVGILVGTFYGMGGGASIALGFNDAMWAKYGLGESQKVLSLSEHVVGGWRHLKQQGGAGLGNLPSLIRGQRHVMLDRARGWRHRFPGGEHRTHTPLAVLELGGPKHVRRWQRLDGNVARQAEFF